MSRPGEALAEAALALVGARFRLHGRDPATGLDCVGLLAAALTRSGRAAKAPTHYALRNRNIASLLEFAAPAGLVDAAGPIEAGDVLLVRTGPVQHHLLVAAPGQGFIHAHAGLRRVVVTPSPLAWPAERHWRLAGKTEEHV